MDFGKHDASNGIRIFFLFLLFFFCLNVTVLSIVMDSNTSKYAIFLQSEDSSK